MATAPADLEGRSRPGAPRVLAVAALALVLAAAAFGAVYILRRDTQSGLALGATLAILPVPVYLSVVLWADRVEPEPPLLLLAVFLWGAAVTFALAYTLNTAGTLFVGRITGPEVADVYLASISSPIVEETGKSVPLFALLALRRAEIDGYVDGLVYATMVALGFATSENVLYYGREALAGGVPDALHLFILRGIWNPFMHPLFTAPVGVGVAYAATRRGRARWAAPLLGLAVAVGLHSVWNTGLQSPWHALTYYLLFMPLLTTLAVTLAAVRARDTRVLAEHLPAALGRDTRVVAELGSPPGRRALRAVARRRAGAAGRRTAASYERAAVELAFLERRVAQGHVGADPDGARRDRMRRRFFACERELRGRRILAAGADAEPPPPTTPIAPPPALRRRRPLGLRPGARPSIAVWFEVSAGRDLVVHVTNVGRRALAFGGIGLSGPPWRPRGPVAALPTAEPEGTAPLQPGDSVRRTVSRAVLRRETGAGRRWVYAGTSPRSGRYRRIPAGVIGHVLDGPPPSSG